jgi:hypothetical protein
MCSFQEAFESYCGAGRKEMDCRGFIKLCRDAGLAGDSFRDSDVERVFQKFMSVTKRRICLRRLQGALQQVAEQLGLTVEDVHAAVAEGASVRISAQCASHNVQKEVPYPASQEVQEKSSQPFQRVRDEQRGRREKAEIDPTSPRRPTREPGVMEQERPLSRSSSASMLLQHKPSSCPMYNVRWPSTAHPSSEQVSTPDAVSNPEQFPQLVQETATDVNSSKRQAVLTLREVFEFVCGKELVFCGLDSKTFGKLCKKSCLVDKSFTSRDCQFIFSSTVPLDQKHMDFHSFELALSRIASRKGLQEAVVHRMVSWPKQDPDGDSPEKEQWSASQTLAHTPDATPQSPSSWPCRRHRSKSLTALEIPESPTHTRTNAIVGSAMLLDVGMAEINGKLPAQKACNSVEERQQCNGNDQALEGKRLQAPRGYHPSMPLTMARHKVVQGSDQPKSEDPTDLPVGAVRDHLNQLYMQFDRVAPDSSKKEKHFISMPITPIYWQKQQAELGPSPHHLCGLRQSNSTPALPSQRASQRATLSIC